MKKEVNTKSIFFESRMKLVHQANSLKSYLSSFSVFEKYELASTKLLTYVKNSEELYTIYASLYPDRIEFYENQTKKNLLFFIASEEAAIFFGDGVEMKHYNFSFNGFILSNSTESRTFYFRNQEDSKIWKPLLQTSFHQNMKLFRKSYFLRKQIGFGSYSKIYIANRWIDNEEVAIKIIEKSQLQKKSQLQSLKNEIMCLKLSNWKNYLKFYEIIEGEEHIYIVMEYFQEGDLFKLIKRRKLKETDILQIIEKIARQLKFYQDHKIYHGDIKLENILIRKITRTEVEPVIIDFGFAQLNSSSSRKHKLTWLIGTEGYTAPEMLEEFDKKGYYFYNDKCDIFGLGVIFYCLVYSLYPFSRETHKILHEKNKECQIEYDTNNKLLNNQSFNLLQRMLTRYYQTRISVQQILEHPAFDKIKFQQLRSSSQSLIFNNKSYLKLDNDQDDCSTRNKSLLNISPAQTTRKKNKSVVVNRYKVHIVDQNKENQKKQFFFKQKREIPKNLPALNKTQIDSPTNITNLKEPKKPFRRKITPVTQQQTGIVNS